MTEHLITPPPELVASLRNSAPHGIRDAGVTREIWLIHNAFAAGADQELEACLLVVGGGRRENLSQVIALRNARRPEPPSLKEQALKSLGFLGGNSRDVDTIRRALEQLDD